MKKRISVYLFCASLLASFSSCNLDEMMGKSDSTDDKKSYEGLWEIESYYDRVKNKVTAEYPLTEEVSVNGTVSTYKHHKYIKLTSSKIYFIDKMKGDLSAEALAVIDTESGSVNGVHSKFYDYSLEGNSFLYTSNSGKEILSYSVLGDTLTIKDEHKDITLYKSNEAFGKEINQVNNAISFETVPIDSEPTVQKITGYNHPASITAYFRAKLKAGIKYYFYTTSYFDSNGIKKSTTLDFFTDYTLSIKISMKTEIPLIDYNMYSYTPATDQTVFITNTCVPVLSSDQGTIVAKLDCAVTSKVPVPKDINTATIQVNSTATIEVKSYAYLVVDLEGNKKYWLCMFMDSSNSYRSFSCNDKSLVIEEDNCNLTTSRDKPKSFTAAVSGTYYLKIQTSDYNARTYSFKLTDVRPNEAIPYTGPINLKNYVSIYKSLPLIYIPTTNSITIVRSYSGTNPSLNSNFTGFIYKSDFTKILDIQNIQNADLTVTGITPGEIYYLSIGVDSAGSTSTLTINSP